MFTYKYSGGSFLHSICRCRSALDIPKLGPIEVRNNRIGHQVSGGGAWIDLSRLHHFAIDSVVCTDHQKDLNLEAELADLVAVPHPHDRLSLVTYLRAII